MALTSESTTLWIGDLKSGSGTISLDSSEAAEFPVTWAARTEGETGRTNPEELLGAAHASCYSMQFSSLLAKAGTPPKSLQVTAAVTFDPAQGGILGSHLLVSADVEGITDEAFQNLANEAKETCPVSRALAGITITLEASLT
ncbi:MAG TPA: OsmC family peroxiredoxin [Terrimesophilobacter sp.]|nr:OsmC family peroxiredoxin [Terrimesophilobacter sp.]